MFCMTNVQPANLIRGGCATLKNIEENYMFYMGKVRKKLATL